MLRKDNLKLKFKIQKVRFITSVNIRFSFILHYFQNFGWLLIIWIDLFHFTFKCRHLVVQLLDFLSIRNLSIKFSLRFSLILQHSEMFIVLIGPSNFEVCGFSTDVKDLQIFKFFFNSNFNHIQTNANY